MSSTAEHYRNFAAWAHGQSPAYERLALAVSQDIELLARLDELPRPKRQPNLLFAVGKYLNGPVTEPAPFLEWVRHNWPTVVGVMLARRTQTNEPHRCATLLPLLARLRQPLALLEVGASAGLCLYPDRYRYRYQSSSGEIVVGPNSSTVEFPCRIGPGVPVPATVPSVVWRAGIDVNPLDVRDDADMRWLEALVWPDQPDRANRLRAAIDVVGADPPRIERADLVEHLPELAVHAPSDATLVVFHTAVLMYLPRDRRAAFVAAVRQCDAIWVSNEAHGVLSEIDAQLRRKVDPARFVLARHGVPVALTGQHGQSLEWLTAADRCSQQQSA
jgi:hypothetical protein